MQLWPAAYRRPPIFEVIASAGQVSALEMASTFNMGLGFLLCTSAAGAARILAEPETPWLAVGEIMEGPCGVDLGYASVR